MRSSKVSRTFRFVPVPPTPSKPTTPEVMAAFGRQRLKLVAVVPAAPTPAAVLVPIVLIDEPFEPVVVIG